MQGHERLWTVPETADRFRVDEKTVRRWIASGRIPRNGWILTPGGQYRIRDAALAALLTPETAGPADTDSPPQGAGPVPDTDRPGPASRL